ncbi:MAG: AMP-binding protein [Candidatus Brocadiales bacterium]|nr:AMP-binding protein [Candidatus Brocadiales bacterium]
MISSNILSEFSENTAIITPDSKQYTYKELLGYTHNIAENLKPRSLVFCLSNNSIGSLAGYLSFIINKVAPVMLDSNLDKELLDNLIMTYKPEYLWMPEKNTNSIEGGELVINILGYSLMKLFCEKDYLLHDDICLLLTTSGSTGSPKLVKLTYENVYSNAESISEYLSIDKNERPITSLPMHYSFGLSIINSHLIKGATILLTNNSLMEKKFWPFLKTYKATSLSGIPYSFEILKKLRFFNMDLPYLKTITQAGGKLNDDLNRECSDFCKKTCKRFFVMYGQTEATARMSYLPPEYSISKLGSMGIAIPGGEFSLIDENGNIIKESDREGELVYKGKNVSMGYAVCRADLAKGDENNGVLVTGDMAKRDSDGYYYIVGRKKRFIKLFGNRVNLDETERLLKNIISDCACSGQDDEMMIYITDDNRVDEIKSYIAQKLGINHKAFVVKCISKIPKNSSGKTIYSRLAV